MTAKGKKSGRIAGVTGIVLFTFSGLFAHQGNAKNRPSSTEETPLGNKDRCARYLGQPQQWGQNSRASYSSWLKGKLFYTDPTAALPHTLTIKTNDS